MSLKEPSSIKPFSIVASKSMDNQYTTLVTKTNSSSQILAIDSIRICNTEFYEIRVELRIDEQPAVGSGPFISLRMESDQTSIPIQAEAPIYLNDNESISIKVFPDTTQSGTTEKVFIYVTGWEILT